MTYLNLIKYVADITEISQWKINSMESYTAFIEVEDPVLLIEVNSFLPRT